MKSRYIVKRVRQAAATRFFFALLAFIFLGLIGAFTVVKHFQQAFFSEPIVITLEQLELEALNTDAHFNFAQIEGTEMFDTGYERQSSHFGIEYGHSYFGALLVGSRLLLIQSSSPIDIKQLSYEGTLSYASGQIRRNIILDMVEQQPELYGVFVPLVLNIDSPLTWFWNLAGILWLIAIGLALWFLTQAIFFIWRPEAHSIMKSLRRYGDLYEVIAQIESDIFFSTEKVENYDSVKIGKRWVVYDFLGSFDAVSFESLVWYHKHVIQTQYRTGLASHTTTVGGAALYDKTGHKTLFGTQLFVTDFLLEAIAEHAPWALGGFSPERLHLWEKQQAKFIDLVETRKIQLQSEESKS